MGEVLECYSGFAMTTVAISIMAGVVWFLGVCVGGVIGWRGACRMNLKAARLDREIIEYWQGRTRDAEKTPEEREQQFWKECVDYELRKRL